MDSGGQLVGVLLGGGLGGASTESRTLRPMSSKVPLPAFLMMFSAAYLLLS